VRSDELDVDDSKIKVHVNHETVLVSTYVEDHTIVANETRMPISPLDCRHVAPISGLDFREPGLQRLLGGRMTFPEFAEWSPGYDSHWHKLPRSQYGNKVGDRADCAWVIETDG
jgi:hypothetical protein